MFSACAPGDITVIAGDTAGTALGLGAFASRQAVTAGNAIHLAAIEVREKAIRAAAEMLEAAPEDLEVKEGAVQVKGVPQLRKTLGEIARILGGVPGFALPKRRHAGTCRRDRLSRRPRSLIATARMSPRSRSMSKPARCGSPATSWCMTAAASSIR